jgi:hypothetical protein
MVFTRPNFAEFSFPLRHVGSDGRRVHVALLNFAGVQGVAA